LVLAFQYELEQGEIYCNWEVNTWHSFCLILSVVNCHCWQLMHWIFSLTCKEKIWCITWL
jgi:hypothetical protein